MRQFYFSVGTQNVKLPTLTDLLVALQATGPFGAMLVCGSRDSLDAVMGQLSQLQRTKTFGLHADMDSVERLQTFEALSAELEAARTEQAAPPLPEPEQHPYSRLQEAGWEDPTLFQDEAALWGSFPGAVRRPPVLEPIEDKESPLAFVLVTTDACFRSQETLPSLPVSLLISYDLPARKDVLMRRLALLKADGRRRSAAGIMVYCLVAGEVPAFRAVEEWSAAAALPPIEVMPVQVSELLSS